jgi:ureidoglycolate lyase
MGRVQVKELSPEAFQAYGTYADMIDPNAICIGEEPVEFYRDMLRVDLGGAGAASLSTCRVLRRPPVIEVVEYHTSCGEGILPLDGDVLIHVAPATPNGEVPLDRVEVFRVPRGTAVSLRPGVWHHAPYAVDTDVANVLIVLPERTYANDCEVYEIPEANQVAIEGM